MEKWPITNQRSFWTTLPLVWGTRWHGCWGRGFLRYPSSRVAGWSRSIISETSSSWGTTGRTSLHFQFHNALTHNCCDDRCYRYIFRNAQKVGLQELGPRLTLKLRSLQRGTFDSKHEYIWIHKVGGATQNVYNYLPTTTISLCCRENAWM